MRHNATEDRVPATSRREMAAVDGTTWLMTLDVREFMDDSSKIVRWGEVVITMDGKTPIALRLTTL